MGPVNPPHALRRSLLWRIHFWAALVASPFVLVATLSGLLYVFTPQIEAALYAPVERVAPLGPRLPLDAAVAVAGRALPGFEVQAVTPPARPADAVRLVFGAAPPAGTDGAHAGHRAPSAAAATVPDAGRLLVFVDPYRGRVLGVQREQDRFGEWARRLHSRMLQGEALRWMIELAASGMLVMLLTGAWLWWPRRGLPAWPRAGLRRRAGWRQWHAFLGALLGLLSLVMVLTGITWSRYAGENVRVMRDWAGQAPPKAPAGLHSMPTGGARLGWQQAWERSRVLVPATAPQLTPPRGPHGVWRVTSAARDRPASRFELVLDAYDGKLLYHAGWERQTAFGKATAVGIPFHRGELGLWNQALLLAFGAGVLFSLLSGWVMFIQRRRAGMPGLPALLPGAWRAMPPAALALGLALCALLPLLAAGVAAVLACEAALAYRGRGARAA